MIEESASQPYFDDSFYEFHYQTRYSVEISNRWIFDVVIELYNESVQFLRKKVGFSFDLLQGL